MLTDFSLGLDECPLFIVYAAIVAVFRRSQIALLSIESAMSDYLDLCDSFSF